MAGSLANSSDLPDQAAQVLAFWLDDIPADKRFARDDAIDRAIAERFGALHGQLSSGLPKSWLASPRGVLAAIIVLDQFSRNLFRDDARAFAQDALALSLTKQALADGLDAGLSVEEKQFLYMPLMHSEELADVERCTDLMGAAGHTDAEEFSRRHAACIARFGRYPARNAALGRATTKEEAAFLTDNPAGF